MADDLTVLDGNTFFVSDRAGDVEPSEMPNGFFHGDMRHLSTWRLLVNGHPIHVLTSRTVDYYSAAIFATLASVSVGENPPISIRRDRFTAGGVHEDLTVENHSDQPQAITIEVHYGTDFADLFEVKDHMPKRGQLRTAVDGSSARLIYTHKGFRRDTIVGFSDEFRVGERSAQLELKLAPRGSWQTCIDIAPVVDGTENRLHHGERRFGNPQPNMPTTFDRWMAEAPRLMTDNDVLRHTYKQSLIDLAALRFRPLKDLSYSLPAAGLPWFMALFGRDSLITAYQALPFQPHLARTTLEALSALQADRFDDFRDAEPGKILHELRVGELTMLGERPHSPYYGTHDATPLFLILLDEYERWTGERDFVRSLKPVAMKALDWLERHGDRDGDGFLEYQTRSKEGLVNQCWKDSWNSILFSDGTVAKGPIATCEIQGYAYDARIRTARLAREVWDDSALADRLEREAASLRERFNRDYWIEARGHYALALDGDKRPVDAMTSNVGHLLWSGIVPEERAAQMAQRLMSPDMFTGWGTRTMSAREAGYNPIEYHNGTVWPHDTAFVAEGLRRYGYREEASHLALMLIQAAEAFAYRLPEVFAGFSRGETGAPVEYPTASRPQAWAAGAPLLALRTALGFDVVGGQLRRDPYLSEGWGEVRLENLPVGVRSGETAAPVLQSAQTRRGGGRDG
ncbi:MAG TPA: glycogen debranching N-terminal domain-containing protein [Candidatus Dormibacteraeota bacterium]|nr:glycogen debranching N-terminal domain-containing protein [Candidatus Dormibacteraeota bacterium]